MEALLYSVLLSTIHFITPVSSENVDMAQTIAVRGQVKCALKNVVNTVVKLGIDVRFVDEQILAIARTNTTGWFELKATVISAYIVRPFFQIYVDQSSGIKCRERYKQPIPDQFIAKQGEPERWYNAGIIDLQSICTQRPGETSCLGEADFFSRNMSPQEKHASVIY